MWITPSGGWYLRLHRKGAGTHVHAAEVVAVDCVDLDRDVGHRRIPHRGHRTFTRQLSRTSRAAREKRAMEARRLSAMRFGVVEQLPEVERGE
jgi:hypothetical protein